MKRPLVIHPFLFAVFPTLFLLAYNIGNFRATEAVVPALKSVISAAALLALLTMVLRDVKKAGLLVSLVALLVGTYGRLFGALQEFEHAGGVLGFSPHWILVPSYATALAIGAYFSITAKRDLGNFTKILNVSAGCLVIIPVFNIGAHIVKTRAATRHVVRDEVELGPATAGQPASLPNIYHIVLDGYARADNLKELYGYDNHELLEYLRSKGFYIAGKSRTNYSHTALSLSSALNFEYLDGIAAKIGSEISDISLLRGMIEDSRVRQFLSKRGYVFAAFQSGWHGTEITSADMYLTPGMAGEFERGVWGTTGVSSAARQRAKDRERVLYAFRQLPLTANMPEPLFVFAHIVAPHPPFVFTAQGEDAGGERYYRMQSANHLICPKGITRSEYIRFYKEQITFVNKLLKETIDGILEQSPIPPIIIIQGDHGPGTFLHHNCLEATYLQDRMCVLNAYYMPYGDNGLLYDAITPVNTFRVILNRYFDTEYEMLEDRSYFATVVHPFVHTDVTEQIGSESDRARLALLRNQDYYPKDISPDRRADGAAEIEAEEDGG